MNTQEIRQRLDEIDALVHELFQEQYGLEQGLDKLLAAELLQSGELKNFNYTFNGGSALCMRELDNNVKSIDQFIDFWFPHADGNFWLQISPTIHISGNADDGDIWVSGDTEEDLAEFATQYCNFNSDILLQIIELQKQKKQIEKSIDKLYGRR